MTRPAKERQDTTVTVYQMPLIGKRVSLRSLRTKSDKEEVKKETKSRRENTKRHRGRRNRNRMNQNDRLAARPSTDAVVQDTPVMDMT